MENIGGAPETLPVVLVEEVAEAPLSKTLQVIFSRKLTTFSDSGEGPSHSPRAITLPQRHIPLSNAEISVATIVECVFLDQNACIIETIGGCRCLIVRLLRMGLNLTKVEPSRLSARKMEGGSMEQSI